MIKMHVPTVEDRRRLLRWLAQEWDGLGEAIREILLAATVHGSMGERPADLSCTCGLCLGCTWAAYMHDLVQVIAADSDLTELPEDRDTMWERAGAAEALLLDGVSARARATAPAAPRAAGRAA